MTRRRRAASTVRQVSFQIALLEDADRRHAEELLFHLDNRADAGATLLDTGRTPPAGWPVSLPDLRSRLNAMTVANIETPDDEVLLGVMDKLFCERNIKPKPEKASPPDSPPPYRAALCLRVVWGDDCSAGARVGRVRWPKSARDHAGAGQTGSAS